MARVRFRAQLACDAQTGLPRLDLAGLTGNIVLAGTTTQTPITDNDGLPITDSVITISSNGFTPTFYVEDGLTQVDWWADPIRVPIDSTAGLEEAAADAADAALAAQAAAEAAVLAATGLPAPDTDGQTLVSEGGLPVWADPASLSTVQWANIPDKPTTFAPSTHTHTVANITDSSALGRQVVAVVDAPGLRALAQAAPSTTVSFPGFGTTAGTSAQGNHSHTAATIPFTPTGSITATNMQDATVQAAASGGGGGTSVVTEFYWRSGAWSPTIPATQPSGVKRFAFYGPTSPTSLPAYTGLGSTQVLVSYDYAPTT